MSDAIVSFRADPGDAAVVTGVLRAYYLGWRAQLRFPGLGWPLQALDAWTTALDGCVDSQIELPARQAQQISEALLWGIRRAHSRRRHRAQLEALQRVITSLVAALPSRRT
jgi:hypothetical protein